MIDSREPYISDVSDEERALDAPYLTLLAEESGQRTHRCARSSTVCTKSSRPAHPESGESAADDGAKPKKGSRLHLAVDKLVHLLALHVMPANADDRAEVGRMAKAIQVATDDGIDIAFVDKGYTGDRPAAAAKADGIELQVVKLPDAKRGFMLLPTRQFVERSFAWVTASEDLAKDYERCASTLTDLHLVAFACVMLKQAAQLATGSPNSL